jgi:hypothetical protein
MTRQEYLSIAKFNKIHFKIVSILDAVEKKTINYLRENKMQSHLFRRKIVNGNVVFNEIFYRITFTFFDNLGEDEGYRENEVDLYLSIETKEKYNYDFSFYMRSVYENDIYRDKIKELNLNVFNSKKFICDEFLVFIEKFFYKALDENGYPDEIHLPHNSYTP